MSIKKGVYKNNKKLTDKQRELAKENIRLSYYMSRKWMPKIKTHNISYEMVDSACQYALVKAARGFDEEKGIKFATFAAHCMNNEVKMLFRKNDNRGFELPISCLVVEDKEGNEMDDLQKFAMFKGGSIEDNYESINVEFLNQLLECLTDLERKMIKYTYFDNLTQKEIATILDLSQSYVSRVVKRALEKMKRYSHKILR